MGTSQLNTCWEIKSNGTHDGTKVWVNGVEIENLLEVEFSAVPDKVPKLKVVMNGQWQDILKRIKEPV